MKLYRILAVLLVSILILGLASVAGADDPPKPTGDLPEPTPTSHPKGSFDPVPIQSGTLVLDPATASITRLELAGDDNSLVPAAPPVQRASPAKGSSVPGPIVLAQRDGETIHILPDSASTANDLLIGNPTQAKSSSQEFGAASSTLIKFENFEGIFPGDWTLFDGDGTGNGEYLWDKVPCFPIESDGAGSGWPADGGADGLGLIPAVCDTVVYPNNVQSWLVYGPFSLADAQSASFDFFFRLVSQSCDPIWDCDFLYWGASTDGSSFSGEFAAGTYTSGPFHNGYNLASLDLSYLGGEPQVWVAIAFYSDVSIAGQGPFVDSISLRKNTDARTYLTDENFDVIVFPNQWWESFDMDGPDNGDYRWDDVPCFARSGDWSMWPAAEGADGLNPCSPLFQEYPNDAHSWLFHGPFSLAGASEAWVDFYFRNESETLWDYFCWQAFSYTLSSSTFCVSGTYTGGPHNNGYNLMRLDLGDPASGDLRGESEVWLAFGFTSDQWSGTFRGPFVDDVRVVVERATGNAVYLPIVFKAPAQPKTNLYVKNQTTGTVSYTVHNTPEGDITCNNIPSGATVPCGTFTSGTYQVSVSTTQCGSNSGEVYFSPGDVTRPVRCVS